LVSPANFSGGYKIQSAAHIVSVTLSGTTEASRTWLGGVSESGVDSPDVVTVTPAGCVRSGWVEDANLICACIEIDPHHLQTICGPEMRGPLLPLFNIPAPKLTLTVAHLLGLLDGYADRSNSFVLETLMVSAVRSIALLSGALPRRPSDGWLAPAALRRVAQLVYDGIGDRVTLEQMASQAGLSQSAFLRAFRGTLGCTPGEFVLRRRTEAAKEMLLRTDMTIADVAHALGYSSAAHFSTAFCSRCAVNPRQFRRVGGIWSRSSE
jgi:AraC family transcriptional regulator